MNKVEAIIRPERLTAVKNALAEAGFTSLNTVPVMGRGVQRGITHQVRGGGTVAVDMLPKAKVELVVRDEDTDKVAAVIVESAFTGEVGDGKLFVTPVTKVIRVRTGEIGESAL
ncbi:MAG: transcriptional regulator [Dehalococcoidales bacterium]|jgi:nitrogen regulatory protein P-II 1|nr:transcriptional regulator [Dehalococcoidales bacterium]MDP6221517.1 P-II family nitrogen regulator [Dehalococcoidales bacterium]MDP7109407.1 P-II family nitrogen regulator [Dehalococcoidales bacterium]MDP7309740.1 P-II family nitrogen regulator [Dehalococcoidales bacterium]MDP7409327.1 P-II family nitrogen regulator [Dehalococcoidales bacterium]|tara:strand:- start:1673 stop:2014 length:342 start_codon:yes stop_codon:yes gene_type:complete